VNCNEIEVHWAGVDGKTEAPSNSPTNKPTMLFITGNATYTNSGSDDLSCKYYPGWVMGLNYCVNDCDVPKPKFMESNPMYEFASLDLCCDAHFVRTERCIRASTEASPESDILSTQIELASIGGRVWDDFNGNQRRDPNEDGLQGVIVDLYECNFHTWVKGTRTSSDGSYFLSRIPPGTYSLKLTALNGYHFVFDLTNNNWRNKEVDPSMATSPCFELQPLQDNTYHDIGAVANDFIPVILADRVSAIDLPESEMTSSLTTHEKSAVTTQSNNAAGASHKKTLNSALEEPLAPSKTYPLSKEKVQIAPTIVESSSSAIQEQASSAGEGATYAGKNLESALHTKSFVRGGNTAVTIQATESATISQHEDRLSQDLRVSQYEDILIKFNVSFLKNETPSMAILRLYSLSSSPVGGSVHAASHNLWNVDIVTWEDAPTTGDFINNIGTTHPNKWVEVDVTEALTRNRDEFVSLRIDMSSSNSHWSARYDVQKVQLRVSL
jgi:hypothetical protein